MKLKLITFSTISALSVGSLAFAQDQRGDNPGERGGRGGGNRHGLLEKTTEGLNLTPEQKAKVQPIIDQTSPQIQTIRRDAEQKIKTLVDNAMAQVRPDPYARATENARRIAAPAPRWSPRRPEEPWQPGRASRPVTSLLTDPRTRAVGGAIAAPLYARVGVGSLTLVAKVAATLSTLTNC